jgi:O-antigen ligase
MFGAGLTAVVWVIAVGVTRTAGFGSSLRAMSRGLAREHLALILLLLTFHAGAELPGAGGGSGALQDAIRGGFGFLALVVIGPRFVAQMRVNRVYRRRMWGLASLLVYMSVGILSVAYTVDVVSTVGKVFEMSVALALVFVLALREDAADAIRRTISFVLFLEGALVLTAVIGFFLAPTLFAVRLSRPGFVFAATMDAPFSGPNGFSVMGAMLTGWGVARAFETPRGGRLAPWVAVMSLGMTATILASGRQGLVILVVSVAALFFIYRRAFTVLVGAPLAVAVAVTQWSTLWQVVLRDQNQGSVATLTGRTTFWAAGWEAVQQQPLTGHGLGISRIVALRPIGKEHFTHLHNGYLEALVGVGVLGFIPLMIAAVRMVVWSVRSLATKVDVPYAMLAFPLILQNAIGMGFGGWFNVNFMLFLLVVGLADVTWQANRSQRLSVRSRRVRLPLAGVQNR